MMRVSILAVVVAVSLLAAAECHSQPAIEEFDYSKDIVIPYSSKMLSSATNSSFWEGLERFGDAGVVGEVSIDGSHQSEGTAQSAFFEANISRTGLLGEILIVQESGQDWMQLTRNLYLESPHL